jgi:hypothetical protein
MRIKSNKSNEYIGAISILNSDEAKWLASHAIIEKEKMNASSGEKIYETVIPAASLSFLADRESSGILGNMLLVENESIYASDKIAHFDSGFAFLSTSLPNGDYLGVTFCEDSSELVKLPSGEEIESEITPYIFLALELKYTTLMNGKATLFDEGTRDSFYEFFKSSRSVDVITKYYDYLYQNDEDRKLTPIDSGLAPDNIECFTLNGIIDELSGDDGSTVSWLVQGMNLDDNLNKALLPYMPVPGRILNEVMQYRGWRSPTKYNVFTFPSLNNVLSYTDSFDVFQKEATTVLEWVRENSEYWHAVLQENDGRASHLWRQNQNDEEWAEIWSTWEPFQKDCKIEITPEKWESLRNQISDVD